MKSIICEMCGSKLDSLVSRLNKAGVENTPYNDVIW